MPDEFYLMMHSWRCLRCAAVYTEPDHRPIPDIPLCDCCKQAVLEEYCAHGLTAARCASESNTAIGRPSKTNRAPLRERGRREGGITGAHMPRQGLSPEDRHARRRAQAEAFGRRMAIKSRRHTEAPLIWQEIRERARARGRSTEAYLRGLLAQADRYGY